ncbi:MAG: class I SAM-dependent methyltransferase [Tenericutes bacterium]|nr:class I SAM-dependent methyltransferase [Mycoplasmatota bacterium]
METVNNFKDYEIISMSNGYKYERWGKYYLKRPDPLVIWPDNEDIKVDAEYTRSNTGGGEWKVYSKMPSSWQVRYEDMVFNLKLMGFKHTGLFPEQAYNWNIIRETIRKSNRKVNVLNLFAYTGGASIAALMEHANVTHVDSSRGMIDWAKENVIANHLDDENIKFYIDDVKKLVKRELRRGNKYDIIIMDPPSFGRGAKNEVWQVSKDLYNLILDCSNLLSDDALLFIVNTYTEGLSKTVIENILKKTIKRKGTVVGTELGIEARNGLVLPCGVTVRWECNGR